MKIKNLFLFIYGSGVVMIIILLILLFNLKSSFYEMEKIHQKNHVGQYLKQSSRDLTQYARAFAITLNPAYKEKYQEVLDIRNGKKEREDGRKISFKDLLKKHNFSDAEMALVLESEKLSTKLVNTEVEAFRLVQKVIEQGSSLSAEEKKIYIDKARDLLFNDAYYGEVNKIMKPIGEFLQHLSSNSNKNSDKLKNRVESIVLIIDISLFLFLLIVIVSYLLTDFKVLRILGTDPSKMINLSKLLLDGRVKEANDLGEYKEGETSLWNTMLKVSNNITDLLDDMHEMSLEHDKGDIEVFIDASKYHNSFNVIATNVNMMVKNHIEVNKKAMACIEEFGKGNFDAPLEKFPGKKAFINETIEEVRANLHNLIMETERILAGVNQGKAVSTRGNTNKSEGDFKKIIGGFNQILDEICISLDEVLSVLGRLANGDLSARMVKKYNGDFLALKTQLNQTLDSLPLEETTKIMEELANGNLMIKASGDYKGDGLKLKNAINKSLDSLNNILNKVVATVGEVDLAARQLSDTSSALSDGATQQASSLEEISSSMNTIGYQTKHNAKNSDIANSLAENTKSIAEKGNNEMNELIKAMDEINDSSQNISKIISVIDGIAFQTNLLALNAAVEAARAGQHGKGFSVVAEEVRSLAGRSATAAKETSEMIENSIKIVERGTSLVKKTGEALKEIQEAVIKVSDLIRDITISSNEQAQGIEQINQGLLQIDKVTHNNTASAEESASAAEILSNQSSQLLELIELFKIRSQD